MTNRPNTSNSITVRLTVPTDGARIGMLTTMVEERGGVVTALDVTHSDVDTVQVDVTCAATDQAHAGRVVDGLKSIRGVKVHKVSDRTFLVHLGGTIEMSAKQPIRNRDDLSMVYTPGVGRICEAIAANAEDARRLTIKRNSVAVVTDGSAVLGLGNIGPTAALPVMEGKAALFKQFAGIDAWPICLDTQDPDEIVAAVKAISPGFAGINLEDISAPRCFEIEARLRATLDIPVFHDDQHGTAIVVLAALRNALRVVGKPLERARVVLCGAGAAGSAILRVLLAAGVADVTVVDAEGVIHPERPNLDPSLAWAAEVSNHSGVRGTLSDAIVGADVFVGVSAANVLTADDVKQMSSDAIVFALANPEPEIDPGLALQTAAVVATGRSDYPNQINNLLAFPGFFRGMLDSSASQIRDSMLMAAAEAISSTVTQSELNASYIIPSVFHPDVHSAVAAAVKNEASLLSPTDRPSRGTGSQPPSWMRP
jgi:malate dehydrogenase (oxaloacetate-decarboxylating)